MIAVQITRKRISNNTDRRPVVKLRHINVICQSEPLTLVVKALVVDLRLQGLKIVRSLNQISAIRIGVPDILPYRIESDCFTLFNANFRRSDGALRCIKLVPRCRSI